MNDLQQALAITKADLEIKKQQAELIKARARKINAEAHEVEIRAKYMQGLKERGDYISHNNLAGQE